MSLKAKVEYPRGRGSGRLIVLLVLSVLWVAAVVHKFRPITIDSQAPRQPRPYRPNWWPGRYTGPTAQQPSSAKEEEGYSIKPIAYVFPQFHAIPENDKFWGANFTEWTSLKKVTKNTWGLEIQHPTEEIGYYNLLDYPVRKRYAKLARDTGLYGFVYHHYWFGRPVMERVLMAMLEDGQPDLPFMLSWANEPWTSRWDGSDGSEILLKQVYGGVDAWRAHFDWLLPFFKHPNHIRVNGKVQFVVYNGAHAHDVGKRMFSAWRKWAVEEGLGGIDIIETRLMSDNPEERGLTDAINEFGFRSGGGHDGTTWGGINRLGTVYHRGAAVSWDNTPRHPSDGGASTNGFAHPHLWKFHILNLMRRIKLDPNPKGEANFLFINAFNEWGEGNTLEPSKQWGANFSHAFREASVLSHSLPWKDELVANAEALAHDLAISSIPRTLVSFPNIQQGQVIRQNRTDIDVCVVIRVFTSNWEFSAPFGLSELLRSLSVQRNKRWRAVVLRAAPSADWRIVRSHVLDAWDPRVAFVDAPEGILNNGTDAPGPGEWIVADWAVENLAKLADEGVSECGMAKYLLVAKSNSTFGPGAFDRVDRSKAATDDGTVGQADIVGMDFDTRKTLRAKEPVMPIPWNERCERLRTGMVQTCMAATPQVEEGLLETDAVLLDLTKFVAGGYALAGKGVKILHDLVGAGWSWSTPQDQLQDEECHMIEGGSYTSCIRSGRFWLDVPVSSVKYESGCYSLDSMGRYGSDMSQWDMAGWKEDPFCLRLSEKSYV